MAGVRRFTEDAVLDKAEALFRRKGYDATSMIDLAEATGVQRGSLYNAFGDKEELFVRTFARYRERFLDDMRRHLADRDVRGGLLAFFSAAIANMTAGGQGTGCFSTRTAAQSDIAGARIQAEVRGFLDALEEILREACERAGADCRLALPPAEAARLLLTFTRGLAVMERVHGDRDGLEQSARALVDLLVPAAD